MIYFMEKSVGRGQLCRQTLFLFSIIMTTPSLQTCRSQHQRWSALLAQSETEIDELLYLLADLPTSPYHTPRQSMLRHAQALNRLKQTIHRLRLDVICSGDACTKPQPATTCPDERFAETPLTQVAVARVSDEYARLKNRCQAFLGELMRLNLI